jgi:hypothetical protein
MALTNFNQPVLKRDAQNNVIPTSAGDVTFRGTYTGSNLIYRGFARPGSAEGDNVWQLALLAYDGSGNLLSIKWPQAANGSASSEWNFNWTGRAGYTYS